MFPPTVIGILSNIFGAALMGAIAGVIAGLFGSTALTGAICGAIAGAVIGAIFGFSPSPADGPLVDFFSGWGFGGLGGGIVGSFVAGSSWLGGFLSAGVGWTLGLAISGIFMAVAISKLKGTSKNSS